MILDDKYFDVGKLKDEERTECEIWSRVMGYFRPVNQWNVGKRQEFADRRVYTIKDNNEL